MTNDNHKIGSTTVDRIHWFCEHFKLEVPLLEYETEEPHIGALLLSDDLLKWCVAEGVNLDWLFLGDASQTAIESWQLIDLRAFRAGLIRKGAQGLRWGNKRNADGTTFTWFDTRSFPSDPPLVVARSQINSINCGTPIA